MPTGMELPHGVCTKRTVIITIDGPAGTGKSTVGLRLGRHFHWRYIDSGAMYRALAFCAQKRGISWADEQALVRLGMALRFDFTLGERGSLIAVDGRDMTQAIYTRSIGLGASQVATLGGVREVLVHKQRTLAQGRGIVMDGRDIGTVVFPQADVKFYLDASPEVRGERRWRELQAQGERVSLDEVIAEIRRRDHEDRTREVSPLRVPEGAYCIDTTHLSIDEVFAVMVDNIHFSGISFCDADLRLERDARYRPHP